MYRKRGLARVFVSEHAAIQAIKSKQIADGDVLVLICGGPLGSGMQETYQITSALKLLHFGKHIAVITDARFSGVSTGACSINAVPHQPAATSRRQGRRNQVARPLRAYSDAIVHRSALSAGRPQEGS